MGKRLFSSLLITALCATFFNLYASPANAGTATCTWNANTETDLAGYRVYYGPTARTGSDPKVCGLCGYSAYQDVGNVTSYTFSNLPNNTTYYFSVAAYDTSNNLSTFSAQVSKQITATSKVGDANADGNVDIFDYNVLVSNYGRTTCGNSADFNSDCRVDIFDFNLLVTNYGR